MTISVSGRSKTVGGGPIIVTTLRRRLELEAVVLITNALAKLVSHRYSLQIWWAYSHAFAKASSRILPEWLGSHLFF